MRLPRTGQIIRHNAAKHCVTVWGPDGKLADKFGKCIHDACEMVLAEIDAEV